MLYDRELTPAFQKKRFRFRQRETVAVLQRSFISRMMCSHVQKRFARHFLTNATTLASCFFVSIFFTPQFWYLYLGTPWGFLLFIRATAFSRACSDGVPPAALTTSALISRHFFFAFTRRYHAFAACAGRIPLGWTVMVWRTIGACATALRGDTLASLYCSSGHGPRPSGESLSLCARVLTAPPATKRKKTQTFSNDL